jgi:hypothetical protein
MTPDVGPAVYVFSNEDVEGGFRMRLRLASLVLLPSANFWILGSNHPRLSIFSYDNLFAFGRLSLRWPNRVHVSRKQVFVDIHLGTFCKFQSSFIYDRLNLSMENIAIVSSMRIRIMSFTISMLFELFW